MTTKEIIGWKTYGVACLALILGLGALSKGYIADGLKGIVFGLALIALRDALAKLLRVAESTRAALDNVRAAIDACLTSGGRR